MRILTTRARLWTAGVLLLVAVGGLVWLASLIFVFLTSGGGEASQGITAPRLTPPPAAAGRAARLYRIVPEASEVRFEVDETLRGRPSHVVSRTDQVAGDLIVDFGNPSASQVGVVRINVRTLRSPSDRRDRAIRSRILQSAEDRFEFAQFAPREFIGLPQRLAVGDTVTFTILGPLTVRDISAEASFETTVNIVSEDRIEGSAVATVTRETYNLVIPYVPFVSNVSNEVLLGIEFTATAVDS